MPSLPSLACGALNCPLTARPMFFLRNSLAPLLALSCVLLAFYRSWRTCVNKRVGPVAQLFSCCEVSTSGPLGSVTRRLQPSCQWTTIISFKQALIGWKMPRLLGTAFFYLAGKKLERNSHAPSAIRAAYPRQWRSMMLMVYPTL